MIANPMPPGSVTLRDANFIAIVATAAGGSKVAVESLREFIDNYKADDTGVKKIARLLAGLDHDLEEQSAEVQLAVERAQEWAQRNRDVHALHRLDRER